MRTKIYNSLILFLSIFLMLLIFSYVASILTNVDYQALLIPIAILLIILVIFISLRSNKSK
jgi:hypothetical protein